MDIGETRSRRNIYLVQSMLVKIDLVYVHIDSLIGVYIVQSKRFEADGPAAQTRLNCGWPAMDAWSPKAIPIFEDSSPNHPP